MTKYFFGEREFLVFPHCGITIAEFMLLRFYVKSDHNASVEKRKIYSHRKNISSNQLFSNFFSNIVVFTKFLPKKCERQFLVFSTLHCGYSLSHFFGRNFVKATFLLKKSPKSWFDEIFFRWEQIFHFSTLLWNVESEFSVV